MASYPGAKVHRSSRRKLGRGQSVQRQGASVTATAATTTVSLSFSVPVVVSGIIDLGLGDTVTLVSQTQTDAQTVVQIYSATCVGLAWSVDQTAPVATKQGGPLVPTGGTF